MTDNSSNNSWTAIGASSTGANHLRRGLPNQDWVNWYPKRSGQLPLIMALSDGHGSIKCFRSHIGSRKAVEASISVVQQFRKASFFLPERQNDSEQRYWLQNEFPRRVVDLWASTVEQDLQSHPFTEGEKLSVIQQNSASGWKMVESNPHLAYGATLLIVMVTPGWNPDTLSIEERITYAQLGDGDILAVADNGDVYRPLNKDPRLMGDETTSISGKNSWKEFRIVCSQPIDPKPALILMSTDGYANSFKDEANFIQAGSDYLEILRSEGGSVVRQNLHQWLEDTSRAGSGDDISVGLLFRG